MASCHSSSPVTNGLEEAMLLLGSHYPWQHLAKGRKDPGL